MRRSTDPNQKLNIELQAFAFMFISRSQKWISPGQLSQQTSQRVKLVAQLFAGDVF